MNWTDLLTKGIAENYRVADNLMALVADDDLSWKPATGSNWMTTGQLLMHLTTACGFCCRGFVTGDWGMPERAEAAEPDAAAAPEPKLPQAEALPTAASVQEAREALAADKQVALAMVVQAGEQRLANEKIAAPWEADDKRLLGEQMLSMIMHLQSHKGQLFYYLKLMGRDVNTMHLWGM